MGNFITSAAEKKEKKVEQRHHLAKVIVTELEANIFVRFHASDIRAHCGIEKKLHSCLISSSKLHLLPT